MTRREQRTNATVRMVRLHEDDGRFDGDFWRAMPASERLEAVWSLALDYLSIHDPHAGEPRLRRSVCRIERRRR